MRRLPEQQQQPEDPPTLHGATAEPTAPEEPASSGDSPTAWRESDWSDLDDPSDLEEIDLSDEQWEAFLADDDELDPAPAPGDFSTFD